MEMANQHQETIEIAITNTGKHDILLGTDWLKAHNPSINWQTSSIQLDRCPDTCTTKQPQNIQMNNMELLPTMEWEMQYMLEMQPRGTSAEGNHMKGLL